MSPAFPKHNCLSYTRPSKPLGGNVRLERIVWMWQITRLLASIAFDEWSSPRAPLPGLELRNLSQVLAVFQRHAS